MAKKIQLQDANGNVLHPLTLGECVTMNNGENLDTLMSKSQMFTPTIAQNKSMFKVGTGVDVDYSANVKDGAYESLVFKGKSLVNLAQFEKLFEATPSVLDTQSVIWYGNTSKHYVSLSMFKPNTKYIVKIGSETPSRFRGIYISGLNMPSPNGYYTEHNGVFTTPSTIPTEANMYIKGVTGETITKAEYSKCQILILEYQEGMENWDTPYFTGLCDSKMPILHNIGATTPITDGLLCWYDGRTGKGNETILEDLSGNENHAVLKNFAFDGEDGWQENGIRVRSYGSQSDKNAIQSNNAIANCKSICIYLTRLQDSAPWYIFDGRSASSTYWYSGGYSNNFNPSKCRKNGETLVAPTHGDMLPKIGEPTMLYFELNSSTPLHPTLMARFSNSEQVNGVFHACMIYDRPLTQKEIEFNMCYLNSFKEARVVNKSEIKKQNKTNILRTSEEIVLREVGGVCDTYNPLTGEYVCRIGEVVITSAVAKSVVVLDKNVRVNIAMSALNGDNGTTKANNTLSDKFYWSEANARDIEGLRVNGNTLHWCISRDKLTSQDLQGVNTWLQSNPITVQYILAEPVTTIVKPSTMTPFAYQNGHVIVESGFEGQSLLPEIEYSVVTGRTGQVTQNTKVLRQQEQQIIGLEELLLTQVVQMEYERTLLQFDYELQMMMLG